MCQPNCMGHNHGARVANERGVSSGAGREDRVPHPKELRRSWAAANRTNH
jgi:hypothetical protein